MHPRKLVSRVFDGSIVCSQGHNISSGVLIRACKGFSQFLMILFLPKFMINVTTLILKLSIFHFQMVMFLVLHPMESISLNSFVLLEHLAMLLTSTLAINC